MLSAMQKPSSPRSRRPPGAWLTRFERSDGTASPDHRESIEYFARLADASSAARMVRYGVTPQGRDLHLFVAGKDGATPARAHGSGKAVVLIQACIHAGEVDGKDALMLLLREMLVSREAEHLLENVVLLVVPILNPDGHERRSPSHRPNQNGPTEAGWRATAQGLNLNRDYTKADAPEMRALLGVYASWRPHLIVDTHTTNGADYRYHVCYSWERAPNLDAGLADWAEERLMPHVRERVEARGFLTGPYIDAAGSQIESIELDAALPRYSTGYASAIDRVGLLVETHALKSFAQRVMATKHTCAAVLEVANREARNLRALTEAAEARSLQDFARAGQPVPLRLELTDEERPVVFHGFETQVEHSPITDSPVITFTGEPLDYVVPLRDQLRVVVEAVVPAAYVIPPELAHLRDRLEAHGLGVVALDADARCEVERSRLVDVALAAASSEGRQTVTCGVERFAARVVLRAGSLVVACAQPRVRLLAHLLEPESPDSFVAWGFCNAFLESKEYAEAYVMEPAAREMLDADPALVAEFERRLEEDPDFRADPDARLEFFFRRSAWYDPELCVDPILRILSSRTLARLLKH